MGGKITKNDNVNQLESKQMLEAHPSVVPKSASQQKQITAGKQDESPPVETTKQKDLPQKKMKHQKVLPNCRISGMDYCVSLEKEIAECINLAEIKGIKGPWLLPKNFPVSWNADKYEISCHPDQAGDFTICMQVDVIGEEHNFEFQLTVNPDPKTLWKNIPSKQDGVYAKPDYAKLFWPCGDKSIAAASQRGRSHAQEGKPRDDDFLAHWDTGTDCAILIVADGAGSAKFSRKGSQIAVQTALEKAREALKPEFWNALKPSIKKFENGDAQARKSIEISLYKVLVQAAWEAKMRIKKEVEEHEEQYFETYKKREKFSTRDYATTLVFSIAKKLDDGAWFIATFWVGDGGMGVYCPKSGKVIIQGTPDGGEYGGQTRFLTEDSSEVWPQEDDAASKIIERRIRFNVVDAFDAVILMTDGITDPWFETDSNLNSLAKWKVLWSDIAKVVPFEKRDNSVADALLKWMDFWSPGNHDDRTMMILY